MNDDELLHAFETQAVSQTDWTHRAHVRVAYLYVCAHPLPAAIDRMRSGLNQLNAVHLPPDTLERGYHETMTVAFMRLVHAMVAAHGRCASSDAFCDEHPQLLTKRVLRLYYTRERILTWEAKRAYVEPDVAPLPQAAEEFGERQRAG